MGLPFNKVGVKGALKQHSGAKKELSIKVFNFNRKLFYYAI